MIFISFKLWGFGLDQTGKSYIKVPAISKILGILGKLVPYKT